MAALPLAAAAAGAGIVSAAPGVLCREGIHQLGGCSSRAQQPSHSFHRPSNVTEEVLIAGAEVVLAGFAVGGGGEPVLGAASVAGEPDVAIPAVPGQGVVLVLPELPLLGQDDQFEHVLVLDVAEQVAGLDIVVAGVQVTGVLQGELMPAGLGVHAHPARLAVPVRQRGVEHLHVHGADVTADPLLEHVDQESPVLLRADRAVGDQVPVLGVERTAFHPAAPAGISDRQGLLGRPLDDRDVLDERGAQLVPQERVHHPAVVAVDGVDGGEHVPVDLVALEHVQAPHHPVEGGLAALVDPVGVVHRPRAVDGNPDQEIAGLQELAPLVGQQGAVGLDRVQHPLPGPRVLTLQFDGAAEEIQAHHRRLAALPGHYHLRDPGMGFQELPDIGLLQIRGHPEPGPRVEHLLRQEEAVLAIQVAYRTRRLRHHMKRQWSAGHRQHRTGGLGEALGRASERRWQVPRRSGIHVRHRSCTTLKSSLMEYRHPLGKGRVRAAFTGQCRSL